MYYYSQSQWLLLFFLYSFLGWVWESAFVSAKQRQWINRGFLHGPWLPIYGSGAILILFLTLPVWEKPVWIFLIGMAGATALEYVTGAVMELLFHVRYWDYSNEPLNINGHICLSVSLVWGCFSILLDRFMHPHVERFVLAIPSEAADILSLGLAVLFAIDVTKSVQAALDLKALLGSLTASSRHLAGVEKRLHLALEQFEHGREVLRQKIRPSALLESEQVERPMAQRKESRKDYLLRLLDQRRKDKSHVLSALTAQNEAVLNAVLAELERSVSDAERSRLESIKQMLLNVQASLHKAEIDEAARRDKDYQRAVAMLYRNPTAVSRQNNGAFQELLSLKKEGKTRKSGTKKGT